MTSEIGRNLINIASRHYWLYLYGHIQTSKCSVHTKIFEHLTLSFYETGH